MNQAKWKCEWKGRLVIFWPFTFSSVFFSFLVLAANTLNCQPVRKLQGTLGDSCSPCVPSGQYQPAFAQINLPALCLAMELVQIRNKSFGFRWHFWRARNSLEILALSCSLRWVLNWLNVFIWEHLLPVAQAVKLQPHRGNRLSEKPGARGVSETIYHHAGMWLFRSEMRGMLAKSQHGLSPLQRRAPLMAKKSKQKKHSFYLGLKQRPYWENWSEQ